MLGCSVFAGIVLGTVRHQKPITVPPELIIDFRLDNNPELGKHQWLKAKVEYIDKGPDEEDAWEECSNTCRRKIHSDHKGCDSSCDSPCLQVNHKIDFYPTMAPFDQSSVLEDLLRKDAKVALIDDYATRITDLIWEDMKIPLKDPKYNFSREWPCWNKAPCSTGYRGFGVHKVTVKVSYRYETSAGNLPRVLVASGSTNLVNYFVPNLDDEFDDNEIDCKCTPSATAYDPGLKDFLGRYPTGLKIGLEPNVHWPTDQELSTYGIAITCPDMNNCVVTAKNPTGMTLDLTLFPGTRLISSDPAVQDMTTIQKVNLRIAPWTFAPVSMPIEPSNLVESSQQGPVSGQSNAVCINMKKKAPTDAVKYEAARSQSMALRLLAGKAVNDRILGPWTQTKFWIASDAATFDQVQKALFPKPSEGNYLKAVSDVGFQTHLDFTKEPFKSCLDPKVLIGGSAVRRATEWFVETMTKANPDLLATWVTHNPKAFNGLFADDAPDYFTKHSVTVANSLCSSSNETVQRAGFAFLMTAVPEAKRTLFAKKGGLTGLCKAIMSDKESVVSKALDVAEAYNSKELHLGLNNISVKAPEAIKARAAALAKEVGTTGV